MIQIAHCTLFICFRSSHKWMADHKAVAVCLFNTASLILTRPHSHHYNNEHRIIFITKKITQQMFCTAIKICIMCGTGIAVQITQTHFQMTTVERRHTQK